MEDFLSQLLKSISSLFPDLSLRGRWFTLIAFLFIVFILIGFIEAQTGWIRLWQIEKRIILLQQLHALSREDILQNADLRPVYLDLSSELAEVHYFNSFRSFNLLITNALNSPFFVKFLGGFLIGGIFFVVGYFQWLRGNPSGKNTAVGALIFAVSCGIIGGLIPTIYSMWINFILYPIIEIIFLLANNRRSRRAES